MTTFSDMILKMAEKYPAPEVDAKPTRTYYHCRSCSDFTEVAQPDDLCPRCTLEQERGYQALVMVGRLRNGAERDHGTRNHAVKFGSSTALCGAKPGRRSVGWNTPWGGRDITCPRCLKKLPPAEHIQNVASHIGVQVTICTAPADFAADNEVIDAINERGADDRQAVDEAPWMLGALAYGDMDLGTRMIVSGGECLEIDTKGGNSTDTEMPF
jgi:hypothetical protein